MSIVTSVLEVIAKILLNIVAVELLYIEPSFYCAL